MYPMEVQQTLLSLEHVEYEIKRLKQFEKHFEDMKADLYTLMDKYNVDNYITPNGIKFTKVNPTEEKTEVVIDFDIDKFKEEQPELYYKYIGPKDKIIRGRKGYLKTSYVDMETYDEKESE